MSSPFLSVEGKNKTKQNKNGLDKILEKWSNQPDLLMLVLWSEIIWTITTHCGSLRNYTNGVIQVTLMECKMRLNNNIRMLGLLHI